MIHAPEVAQEELHDVSIAYGHLVRASQLQQFSDHFVEVVCEQVGTSLNQHYHIKIIAGNFQGAMFSWISWFEACAQKFYPQILSHTH